MTETKTSAARIAEAHLRKGFDAVASIALVHSASAFVPSAPLKRIDLDYFEEMDD